VSESWVILGGAGFIGSHFADALMASNHVSKVRIIDNFSSGKIWHIQQHQHDARFTVVDQDLKDLNLLTSVCEGFNHALHLASNPEISRAAVEPTIDFDNGTLLTQNALEASRRAGIENFVYASGSGVYGDCGDLLLNEDHGPLITNSTYGASKLAGESVISAYCNMFDMRGTSFRFANVVGPRQTHGVVYDFIRKLRFDPQNLSVMGNGYQSKSYINVKDVVSGVLMAIRRQQADYRVFNIATDDYVNVREIVQIVFEAMEILQDSATVHYSDNDRGWKGDVPVVRLDTARIKGLGWESTMNTRSAIINSAQALLKEYDLESAQTNK